MCTSTRVEQDRQDGIRSRATVGAKRVSVWCLLYGFEEIGVRLRKKCKNCCMRIVAINVKRSIYGKTDCMLQVFHSDRYNILIFRPRE